MAREVHDEREAHEPEETPDEKLSLDEKVKRGLRVEGDGVPGGTASQ